MMYIPKDQLVDEWHPDTEKLMKEFFWVQERKMGNDVVLPISEFDHFRFGKRHGKKSEWAFRFMCHAILCGAQFYKSRHADECGSNWLRLEFPFILEQVFKNWLKFKMNPFAIRKTDSFPYGAIQDRLNEWIQRDFLPFTLIIKTHDGKYIASCGISDWTVKALKPVVEG